MFSRTLAKVILFSFCLIGCLKVDLNKEPSSPSPQSTSISEVCDIDAPHTISDLKVWVSARDMDASENCEDSYVDGSSVSSWTSKISGAFTQSTGAKQPVYRRQAFPSGAPGVEFDGTKSMQIVSDISEGPVSIAIVFKSTGNGTLFAAVFPDTDNAGNFDRNMLKAILVALVIAQSSPIPGNDPAAGRFADAGPFPT